MTLTQRDSDPWCLNGWPGCDGNYTGGHYCRKDYQHSGRCVCADCGATTTKPAPPAEEDMSVWDICNDGGHHQWRPDPGNEDGMVCGGCGVSEAGVRRIVLVTSTPMICSPF